MNAIQSSKIFKNGRNTYNMYKSKSPSLYPILTDVSLQDGLRSENREPFSFFEKKKLYHKFIDLEIPYKIEIGLLSENEDIYDYIYENNKLTDMQVLVPSYQDLGKVLKKGVQHLSFMTSCSNKYQEKYANQTLKETTMELDKIFCELRDKKVVKKLYISCINECPIDGKIDNDFIIHQVVDNYQKYDLEEICLSDTCGSLTFKNYKYLIDSLLQYSFLRTKIGLNLRINNKNQYEMEEIIRYSIKNNICRFDVSMSLAYDKTCVSRQFNSYIMSYNFLYRILFEKQ